MGISSTTYYNGFGGAGRDFTTRHSQAVTFDAVNYRQTGGGRDTYISLDNGGIFHPYRPDHNP